MGSAVLDGLIFIDNIMYYPFLMVIMAVAGICFTFRTRGVQIRLVTYSHHFRFA